VPLLREGEAIGVIVLARRRVEPFTDRQIELVSAFADQAVIAIENTRLSTEKREALEQQTATAEVLQVINANPGDLTPVFDAILDKAHTLCGAVIGSLVLFDGTHFRAVATHGLPEQVASLMRHPVPPNSRTQELIDGMRFRQIEDIRTIGINGDYQIMRALVEYTNMRTVLFVPLRKDGALRGFISAYRPEVRAFSDKEIALLENFAAQAVIATENARLLTEQREALEQQTATAEVLQVINASPGNLAPVFDVMLQNAMRLCEASFGSLWTLDGDRFRPVAHHGLPLPYAEYLSREAPPAGPGTGRARLLAGAPYIQILDLADDEPYRNGEAHRRAIVDLGGARTALLVSLRRDDVVLGLFMIYRKEVRPFSDKQIALAENFAAQAVIAMENARLLIEQREALEQQTATAEVLRTINENPGNLGPVFDVILEKALSLAEAAFGSLWIYHGDTMHAAATRGMTPALAEFRARNPVLAVPPVAREASETRSAVQMLDIRESESYRAGRRASRAIADLGGARTNLVVPLLKVDEGVGCIQIYRQEVRVFTPQQISLLEGFAAQAVIAMENARLLTEQREALEQQTATAEVLQVINASPGDLAPVFEAILEKAHRLCGATLGSIVTFDGEHFRAEATHGYPERYDAWMRGGWRAHPQSAQQALIEGKPFVHVADLGAPGPWHDDEFQRTFIEATGVRTFLVVPLRNDGSLLGFIAAHRKEARAFTDKEITLLENFAAQAVIAMENARLLNDQREALEQQTATAEVLQVINTNPGNLVPVFDAMLNKAVDLCGAAFGILLTYDGERFHHVAFRSIPEAYVKFMREHPPIYPPESAPGRLALGERLVHMLDITDTNAYRSGEPNRRAMADLAGARTVLSVALCKDEVLLGVLTLFREEVRAFTDKQIALLQNFAAQAVIAMENARLLDEIRQRQEEIRVTFENMGDGVALFDETRHLVASNRRFQDMLDVPDDVIASRPTFSDYIHYLADHGEYGPDPEDHVQQLLALGSQRRAFERTRPNGRIIEVRVNPVPSGGFVVIYSDITERKRNEEEIRTARDAAEEASRTIEAAYRELKTAQANLIQAEKMASLGQLTAGIAHEIKNPLNFVNNFAELSGDLLDELNDAVAGNRQAEIDELTATLQGNLAKITEHGKRADGIVKAMLEHSRGSSGERRIVDLNALIDEALNLAYHGARAQDQSFNITLDRDFAAGIAPIELAPQDMTRVFLNLFSNGFYAATRRARIGSDAGFMPTLKVVTREAGETVEVRVRDNGIGIAADIRDKLFQPFFTTKPTGEGTGLGLSISYDIITQQHGGNITVASKVGEYSEFTIRLPRSL
jgi:GAF domain-containing protein/nitrogen-specific signal transduction histidine kinase